MSKLFSTLLAMLGLKSAAAGSQACVMYWIDEPECPKSLIK